MVAIQKKEDRNMIHPSTELRPLEDRNGYGIFSLETIPRGTMTWVLDSLDRVLFKSEIELLSASYGSIIEKYIFKMDQRGIFFWDNAKYVNYSFQANCLGTHLGFEIAVSDILPGMQLTREYSEGPKKHSKKAFEEALMHYYSVPQPLAPLLDPSRLKKAIAQVKQAGGMS
jgi:hypothetical protein